MSFSPIDFETRAPADTDAPIEMEVRRKTIDPAIPTAETLSISSRRPIKNRSSKSTKKIAIRPIELVLAIFSMCVDNLPVTNFASFIFKYARCAVAQFISVV
jgi:hypothetical protein